MEQAESKIESMNDDINVKFQNTDNLKQQFEDEKYRMSKIRKFLQTYKNGLSK